MLKGVHIAKNESIRFYASHYRLISLAVLIAVAVIVGSLLIGNSVRQTLIRRVNERLGKIETVIFSRNSFLSDSILLEPLFANSTRGILLSDGFISSNGQLLPVMVWGMEDDSFNGKALLNQSLSDELHLSPKEDIILRLPKGGLVPSGSLFVTDNYTASLRLEQAGIKHVDDGGNISLRNEQSLPLNIFVSRSELAEAMEVTGKINLLLSEKHISESDFATSWKAEYSGIKIRHSSYELSDDYVELTTERVFLQEALVNHLDEQNDSVNHLFSYLANSIRLGNTSVPYSFATALDEFKGYDLKPDELLLSDYSAHRLGAKIGDSIIVSFFVSKGLKDLKTDSVCLSVGGIIPLNQLVADGALSADFPGLSDVEHCTDWDSDLPIDMSLITDEDEEYWNLYRSTPKVLLPYGLMKSIWSNDYGTATALRFGGQSALTDDLNFSMFDVQVIHPRESAMYAARNSIDFSGLFLALGFFIIISAILLFVSPLSEMYWQRREETNLLSSLGYSDKRIVNRYWNEAFPVVGIASLLGVLAGIIYTIIVMWFLGTIWNGATQTTNLGVYINVRSVIIGLCVSLFVILILLNCQIKRTVEGKSNQKEVKRHNSHRFLLCCVGATVLSAIVFVANISYLNSIYLFVLCGLLYVIVAGMWGEYIVRRKSVPLSDGFSDKQQTYATLFYGLRQARVSYYALAFGIFAVFAVGLNRQQAAGSVESSNATGGFSLWAETTVPVYYDLMTHEGRSQLSLDELPESTTVMQALRLGADDASCLNLNKVTQPTILGIDMPMLQESAFQITQGISDFREYVTKSGDTYPVILDQESLIWSLGLSVGDTLHYQKDNGEPVNLLIAGTLATGIFQGFALMDTRLFKEIWPEISGSKIMLIKTKEPQQASQLLSQALNEYGIRVMTTDQRLNKFNELVNTYLSIFLSLGGVGMLLGILSFVVVIRKNLLVRRNDVQLYQSIGYSQERIQAQLFHENIPLPLYAVASGTLAALLSTCYNFGSNDVWTWLQAMVFALMFVGAVGWFVKRACHKTAVSNPEVQTLMI